MRHKSMAKCLKTEDMLIYLSSLREQPVRLNCASKSVCQNARTHAHQATRLNTFAILQVITDWSVNFLVGLSAKAT